MEHHGNFTKRHVNFMEHHGNFIKHHWNFMEHKLISAKDRLKFSFLLHGGLEDVDGS